MNILLLHLMQHKHMHSDISQDELLKHLVGKWLISREFPTRKAENTAEIEFVLGGKWLRIAMQDTNKPAKYLANVYVTLMADTGKYSMHWLDNYGGTVPEVLGEGVKQGNSIVFTFTEPDATLKNTFTWDSNDGLWISKIEQAGPDKIFKPFCIDTYRRK